MLTYLCMKNATNIKTMIPNTISKPGVMGAGVVSKGVVGDCPVCDGCDVVSLD